MNNHFEEQYIEAYNTLKPYPELLKFIKHFNSDNGFMFSNNSEINEIGNKLSFQGHSGCSFALTLRKIQHMLNNHPEITPFDS